MVCTGKITKQNKTTQETPEEQLMTLKKHDMTRGR